MAELGLSVLRIVALAWVGLSLWLFLRQSHYVYFPDRSVDATPADLGIAFEDLRLKTSDGETLQAWHIPATSPADVSLLFCHGNAGDIGDRLFSIQTFHRLGLNVLVFDYRGYGQSTGKPTEAGTHEDAITAWRHLTDTRGVPPDRIILFGRSLGGAVAARLANEVHPAGLVIESTFTSIPDMAHALYPYLPTRLLCRFRYDARRHVGSLPCPLLVAHSVDDDMIPFAHGQRIFEAASEPKQFVEMRGGHNAGGLDVDPDYQRIFSEFVRRCTPSSPPAGGGAPTGLTPAGSAGEPERSGESWTKKSPS